MLSGYSRRICRLKVSCNVRSIANFKRAEQASDKSYAYSMGAFILGVSGGAGILSASVAVADADKYNRLSTNFIANAAELASPSVVNILCPVYGMMVYGMSSGSGFIISKVS